MAMDILFLYCNIIIKPKLDHQSLIREGDLINDDCGFHLFVTVDKVPVAWLKKLKPMTVASLDQLITV